MTNEERAELDQWVRTTTDLVKRQQALAEEQRQMIERFANDVKTVAETLENELYAIDLKINDLNNKLNSINRTVALFTGDVPDLLTAFGSVLRDRYSPAATGLTRDPN